MSEQATRRSALARGLVLVGGLVGLGAAGAAGEAVAAPGATTLVLYAGGMRGFSHDRRHGELARSGDRVTFEGELRDRPDGRRVGELHAAAFTLRGPGGGGAAERIELHTFVLEDGTLVGSGAGGASGGSFAILGGTGRFAGARGSYVLRRSGHEPGGHETAELAITLL